MNLPEAIGGYFGWEMPQGLGWHRNLKALNTGRNAFEYILRAREYRHVYIPYYTCEAVLEPLIKLNIGYDFYHIDEQFEPIDVAGMNPDSGFLYTNYFGLKSEYIKGLVTLIPNLIVDASQAFFAQALTGIDSFYSPRKFCGVPDGGYVSCDVELLCEFEADDSIDRTKHLVKRMAQEAEEGYADFQASEVSLCNQPIKKMSKLTRAILNNINFLECLKIRNENFCFLHNSLQEKNGLKWLKTDQLDGPMVYPFYSTDRALRTRLIDQRVYIAKFWPNVLDWVNQSSIEYKFVENLLPLPIDQRYGKAEMKKIIGIING